MNYNIQISVWSQNFVVAFAPVIFCLDYTIHSASAEVAARTRGIGSIQGLVICFVPVCTSREARVRPFNLDVLFRVQTSFRNRVFAYILCSHKTKVRETELFLLE
jgi:hypothetical protein